MWTRRRFIAASGAAALGAAPKRAELGILIWAPHSIIDANNRGDAVTPELIGTWIGHCAGHGATSIFWRGSYVGRATYHSSVLPVMEHADRFPADGVRFKGTGAAQTLKEFNGLAAAIQPFDTLDAARGEARRRGLLFCADITPFDKFFPGLEETWYEARPDLWLWSRDGKQRLRGLPCYAEPAARARLLDEVKELAARGVDGISVGFQSHMGAYKEPLLYGFNPPMADLYKQRSGVDMRTQDYDPDLLSRLNGEVFTSLLTDIRRAIGKKKRLSVSIHHGGYRPGAAWGSDQSARFIVLAGTYKIDLNWPRWLEDGLIDDLVVMPASDEPSVDEVRAAVKSKVKGKVLLGRKVRDPVMLPVVRNELAAVRDAALDGLIVGEGRIFEPAHTKWCELFS
jgi:hypothetical protein